MFMERNLRHLQIIKLEFKLRQEANPSYSLRAFAKKLGVASGALSEILSHKRRLSFKWAEKIIESLQLDSEEKEAFLTSVALDHEMSNLKRKPKRVKSILKNQDVDDIYELQFVDNEAYEEINEWYYNAITELSFVEDFQSDENWIAGKLGLDPKIVKDAIETLIQRGLMERNNGLLKKVNRHTNTKRRSQTSRSLKYKQNQILNMSKLSLEKVAIEKRNHTGITMAIDPEQIPYAKKRIQQFMFELCEELESKGQKEVYQMAIQLFPLKGDLK